MPEGKARFALTEGKMTGGNPSPQSKALDIYRGCLPAHELLGALKPVLDRLTIYDRLRINLEEQETDPQFWKMMTKFLAEKIVLRANGLRYEFALTEPGEVKKALRRSITTCTWRSGSATRSCPSITCAAQNGTTGRNTASSWRTFTQARAILSMTKGW